MHFHLIHSTKATLTSYRFCRNRGVTRACNDRLGPRDLAHRGVHRLGDRMAQIPPATRNAHEKVSAAAAMTVTLSVNGENRTLSIAALDDLARRPARPSQPDRHEEGL